MKKLMIATSLLALTPTLAFAETWTLNTSMGRYDSGACTNMVYWTNSQGTKGDNTTALIAGDDYVFAKVLRVNASNVDFPGRKLTMKSGGTLSFTASRTFKCADFICSGGTLNEYVYMGDSAQKSGYPYSDKRLTGKLTIEAGATVTAYSDYDGRGMKIDSALYGSADSILQIGAATAGRKNSKWIFSDTANFSGEIRVMASARDLGYPSNWNYGTNYAYGVQIAGSSMPGKIHLYGPNTVLFLPDGDKSASVDALELDDGSVIRLEDVKQDTIYPCLMTVTNSLSVNGKITVRAVYTQAKSTTGNDIRKPILRGPKNVRIDPKQFVFETNPQNADLTSGRGLPQRLHLEVDTDDDGYDTLMAVIEPIVTMVKGTAGVVWLNQMTYTSSFVNPESWSDGRLPHADAHYVKDLGYGDTPIGLFEFPCKSFMYHGAGTYFHTTNQETRIEHVVIGSGGGSFTTDNASDIHLVGKTFKITNYIGLYTWNYSTIKLDTEIIGSGNILCKTAGHGTSYHSGTYEFPGLNTNFTGKIEATFDGSAGDFLPMYSAGRQHKSLRVTDGRNLGGRMKEFTYDAFAIGSLVEVLTTNDVTLAAGLNRGLTVVQGGAMTHGGNNKPGGASLNVLRESTLTIHWPLTVSVTDDVHSVTLWKDGNGTLALGGTVSFLTTDGPVSDLPSGVQLPVLCVTNGTVTALNADCMNGLTVHLATNRTTTLKVDYGAGDANLLTYGIRNTKTDVPFGSEPIRIEATGLPDLVHDGDMFGVLTVRTSAADAIASRLTVTKPKKTGFVRRLVRTDDAAAGTTTFSVKYIESGMVLTVR